MSEQLTWDPIGERYYETGVDRGVIYPMTGGTYGEGEAWNGLINVTLSPSGAEATPLYANNQKYLNLISLEELGYSIEAYTYPDGFAKCNGEDTLAEGIRISQQARSPFGFTFRSLIGNDTEGTTKGYKIHIIYGSMAAPSENANATVNDSPEAKTMSWECTTTPISVTGFKPTSHIEIDSRTISQEALTAIETALYGSTTAKAKILTPDEIVALVKED